MASAVDWLLQTFLMLSCLSDEPVLPHRNYGALYPCACCGT
jgi:hypothetical protein